MSAIAITPTDGSLRRLRIDAEFYASPLQASTTAMFAGPTTWLSMSEVSRPPTSGATPKNHNLSVGDVPFITIDGIDQLWLDVTRSKRVTVAQRDRELRRVRLQHGDVVVTIKRRICNAAVVGSDAVGSVVNQDVAVLRATGVLAPEVIAACLVSRVGQSQARLLQTEQINPYLSVTSLNTVRFPHLASSVQDSVVKAVEQRAVELAHAEAEMRAASALVAAACGLELSQSGTTTVARLGSVRLANRLDAEFFTQSILEFTNELELSTLGDVTTHLSNGATPAAAEYSTEGLPIYKVGGLSRFGVADWLGDRVMPGAGAARAIRARVQTDDVLILAAAHDTRYIGKSAVVQELPTGEPECRVVGEVVVARPGPDLTGPSLSAYMNVPSVRREAQRLVRGQSAHLYSTDLGTLPVPILPRDVQERIDDHFEACRIARERSLAYLDEAKALVDKAVFGMSS